MPDDELATQPDVDRMLEAALGGQTLHQLLMQTSLADSANVAERQAAIAKNRERALKLLAAIDKSLT